MKLLLSFLFIFCSLSSCVIDDDDRDIPRRERRERRGPRADRDTRAPAGDTNPSPAVSPGGVASPSPGGPGGGPGGRPVGGPGGSLQPPRDQTGAQPGSHPPATAPEKDTFFSPMFDPKHTSISLSLTPDAVPHTKVTMAASPKEHPLRLESGQRGSVVWIHTIGDKKVISIRFPDFDKILYFELKTSATEVLVFQGKELYPGTLIA